MNTTAKDIQEFCLASISALCSFPNSVPAQVYRELAETSGLSKTYIRQFHKGTRPNLTTDALDRLVAAVKKALSEKAA